jgi:hypothetical protein
VLKIQNQQKLLGTRLIGIGTNGAKEWVVTSIKAHIHHYVIFIEQTELGWERKVVLDRTFTQNRDGKQYKLECGNSKVYLFKDNIDNMKTFSQHLEYFLS